MTALSSGDVTFVTDEYGDVRGDVPEQGLFVQGVRVLERLELVVGGNRPELLEHRRDGARARHVLQCATPDGALLSVRRTHVLVRELELWITLESASADVAVSSLALRLGSASPLTVLGHVGGADQHALLFMVGGFATTVRFSAPPAIGPDNVSYPLKLPPRGRWTLGVRIAVTCPP
jgi:hypothetical protein